MGILNVTPDSFHAGSRIGNLHDALVRGRQFLQDGAAILDIGGESTRPGAVTCPAAEECDRVLPVVTALRQALPEVLLSVDTRHTRTAQAALNAGADIINNVSGCAPEDGMLEQVAASGAGYILTHASGNTDETPLLDNPETCTDAVIEALLQAAEAAERIGVKHSQILLDPGIGFGKTAEVSIRLLQETARFAALPYPLLIGVSRKRFLSASPGQDTPEHRAAASLGAALAAIHAGADAVRVHDVRETFEALRLFSLLTPCEETPHV